MADVRDDPAGEEDCAAPRQWAVVNASVVTLEQVLDDAAVVVEDDRIASVVPRGGRKTASMPREQFDAGGSLLLPGLVDLHTDALERVLRPRPTVMMPWHYAVAAVESDASAAGITTMFHGASFAHQDPEGVPCDVDAVLELCARVDALNAASVDHRLLHRLDVRSERGVRALRRRMDSAAEVPLLVSHEDHTPGQGQYADRGRLEALMRARGAGPSSARHRVDALIAEAAQVQETRSCALSTLAALAASGRARLLGHDPVTAEDVWSLRARGGTAAEFPLTEAAAAEAHAVGLLVVAGAPNALRGASHNGNVSVQRLAEHGLVDALASDYAPGCLLAAAWELHRLGLLSVPRAIALVTDGPARVARLRDRGRVEAGALADLVAVDVVGGHPRVRATWRRGTRVR